MCGIRYGIVLAWRHVSFFVRCPEKKEIRRMSTSGKWFFFPSFFFPLSGFFFFFFVRPAFTTIVTPPDRKIIRAPKPISRCEYAPVPNIPDGIGRKLPECVLREFPPIVANEKVWCVCGLATMMRNCTELFHWSCYPMEDSFINTGFDREYWIYLLFTNNCVFRWRYYPCINSIENAKSIRSINSILTN